MVSCTAPALPGDAPPYERHRSEQTPLYALVEEHFPRFLERIEDEGASLPYFVREEFEPADDSEQLLGAAVHYRIATGPHAGRKALTLRTVGPSPLTLTLEDIRHSLDPRREEVALERIEAVLRQVQTLGPPGVAARSLEECLALQLGRLPADTEWRDAALALVTGHLPLLASKSYGQLMTSNVRELVHAPPRSIGGNCGEGPSARGLPAARQGGDFDAPDHGPVDLVFGLLVPQESTDEHLETLASIARGFAEDRVRASIRSAQEPARIREILVGDGTID